MPGPATTRLDGELDPCPCRRGKKPVLWKGSSPLFLFTKARKRYSKYIYPLWTLAIDPEQDNHRLTGNNLARVGRGHRTILQAQSDGGTGIGLPGQSGGLASSELVTTGWVVEGISLVVGVGDGGEEGRDNGGEGTHIDRTVTEK